MKFWSVLGLWEVRPMASLCGASDLGRAILVVPVGSDTSGSTDTTIRLTGLPSASLDSYTPVGAPRTNCSIRSTDVTG
jgi:hypothetical protein